MPSKHDEIATGSGRNRCNNNPRLAEGVRLEAKIREIALQQNSVDPPIDRNLLAAPLSGVSRKQYVNYYNTQTKMTAIESSHIMALAIGGW